MKLLIVSDLHIEFGEVWEPPQGVDYDVLVLAGDIDAGTKGFERFRSRDGRPMIYVCGNHELYGRSLPATIDELRALSSHDAHFLENSATVIDGVRFLGATLWTDFELHGLVKRREATAVAAEQMADYSRIFAHRNGPRAAMLTPADTLRLHQESRAWLTCELAKAHTGPTVVVTHAAPSLQSIALRFRTDMVSAAFASDLEALIKEYQPTLWIHGHTHNHADYHIGATRVVGNPRGYPCERGVGLQNGLVIEV